MALSKNKTLNGLKYSQSLKSISLEPEDDVSTSRRIIRIGKQWISEGLCGGDSDPPDHRRISPQEEGRQRKNHYPAQPVRRGPAVVLNAMGLKHVVARDEEIMAAHDQACEDRKEKAGTRAMSHRSSSIVPT
jgi:hypothetical protein